MHCSFDSFDQPSRISATMDTQRYIAVASELRNATLALILKRFIDAANGALSRAAERMNRRPALY